METLLILSCVLIILAIPFGIKESIAVKKYALKKQLSCLAMIQYSINNPHVKDVTWFVLGMYILWEMQRKTSNKHCML